MAEFEDIARDLLNLEINTIEKENMTAQKMPSVPHVLLDISVDYLRFMTRLGLDPRPYWPRRDGKLPEIPKPGKADAVSAAGSTESAPETARNVALWHEKPPPFPTDELRNGPVDLGHLRWLAYGLAVHPEMRKREFDVAWNTNAQVLDRIVRNCDELREIVRKLTESSADGAEWQRYLGKTRREVIAALRERPPPSLDLGDATRIRKIWEIGTERVVLQTVIQVDGDVITRVRPDLADRESDLLFRIHLEGIKTSVASWRHLLDIVAKLAGRAISALVGSRG